MTGNGKEFSEETVITNFIPTIAKTWENTLTIGRSDFINRFNHLLETYEVLLKSLAAILYGRLRHYNINAPEVEQLLRKSFRQPTLGTFPGFIEFCLKALQPVEDAWTKNLKQGLDKKLSGSAVANICWFSKKLQGQEWRKTKITVYDLFKIFVELRNQTRGHGVIREDICDDVHGALVEVFRVLHEVLEGEWYVVQSVQNISGHKQQYEMCKLSGISKKSTMEDTTETHLINGRLYASDPRVTPPWIDLWPLAYWESGKREIYLYNDNKGGKKVHFLCYSLGDHFHLEGVTFEDLFSLSPETSEFSRDESSAGKPSEEESLSESITSDHSAAAMILKGKNTSGEQDESLIFVSYARADDRPLPGNTEGWVTTLVKRLKKQLDLKLGYEAKIDHPLNGNAHVASEIIDIIPHTALLIVILSPNYVDSDWCQGELLRMMKERVRDSSVFVIERNQLEDTDLPQVFDEVTDYRYDFYVVDREEGSPHVLMPNRQQDVHRYNNLLTRLNRDLADKLQKLQRRQKHAPLTDTKILQASGNRPTVFLAGVTDDLEDEREEIKSSLTEANIQVIPEICYFNEPRAFEKAVRDDLAKSSLFVQLLGPRPGKKPPALPQGYVYRQYELAQEAGKRIMQWRSPELNLENIHSSDWRDFLKFETVHVRELDEFTSEIIKIFSPPQPSEREKNIGKRPLMVFIDVYNDDLALADNLCQILDKLGAGYFLPLQSDKPSENREAFEQYVLNCDATMIVYGDVTPKWVSDQVMAVNKISWQREQGLASVILDGPPRQKPPEQKPPITFKLPGMEILQCRNHLDAQQVGNFIQSIQVGLAL